VIKQIVKIVTEAYHFLSTAYKILSNILLSRLTPYEEEIIGDHKWGFGANSSTSIHIFCIYQILEKKWEYNEAVHQLFIGSRKPVIRLGGRSYIIFTVETSKANTVVSQ
jgi:hypothetical protein